MKIKSLELTDLLCHVDSKIEFGEHLTVLTGLSDSGKSGAMRGLLQLLRNQPAGIDLLRHGAKRGACSTVRLRGTDFEGNPLCVERRRSKSRNEYELNGQALVAFGQDVPTEIAEKLHLSEHAFQSQQEGHFLLSAKEGYIAKVMSSTVGLAQIDAAFALIAKKKTANDAALKAATTDFEKESAALQRYDRLEEASDAVNEWENAVAATGASAKKAYALGALIAQLEKLPDTDVATMAAPLARFCISGLKGATAALSGAIRRQERLSSLVAALEGTKAPAQVGAASVHLRKLAAIAEQKRSAILRHNKLAELINSMVRLPHDQSQKIDDAEREVAAYRSSAVARAEAITRLASISDTYQRIKTLEDAIPVSEKEVARIRAAIEEYKASNPVCPECGADQEHWKK